MRENHDELHAMLTALTACEVVPQGSGVQELDLYLTYLDIPGGVDGAFDGGGPYPVVWQIDVWARASELTPDPEDFTGSISAQVIEHFKGLPEWSIRQMPRFTAPNEDEDGYARAMLKVMRTYSL